MFGRLPAANNKTDAEHASNEILHVLKCTSERANAGNT